MKRFALSAMVLLLIWYPGSAQVGTRKGLPAAEDTDGTGISLAKFRDGINHWGFLSPLAGTVYERYSPSDVINIADNLIRYQNKDGGWLKNVDWLAKLDPDSVRASFTLKKQLLSTLDNRNTYSQVEYLSRVYSKTGIERFRASAEKGLKYILDLQNKSGGWRGWDADAITYNDDVMAGVMNLLLDIQEGKKYYAWINDEMRLRVKQALKRAIAVTLDCQITVKGVKTGWCQQHDHVSLLPVKARTYELPSVSPPETAGVVEFLMRIKGPDERIINAVESAVAWLDKVKIEGLREKKVPVDKEKYPVFRNGYDVVMVKDPSAPPVWARYYEIETNIPFMANRDGRKVYDLKDVAPERRIGYGWYSYRPQELIEKEYPAWKKDLKASHRGS